MNSDIKVLNIRSIKSANHWIVSFATIYLLLALDFLIIRIQEFCDSQKLRENLFLQKFDRRLSKNVWYSDSQFSNL